MTLVFEQYANSFESPKLSSLALFSVLAGPDITPPTSIGTSVRDKCQLQLGGSVQAKLIAILSNGSSKISKDVEMFLKLMIEFFLG